MIKRIKTLQGCGIFRNFKWGNLPEFAKFNLIYGQNWTGKTTLSKMLRCLELHDVPIGEVHISTDEHDVRGVDFPNSEVPVRVFNDDFVKNNVFSMKRKDIPPIIVLGRGDKKKQGQLQSKMAELAEICLIRDDNVAKARTAENKLNQHCKICAKNIKKILGGYGDGNTYGGYSARSYRKRAEEMLNSRNADTHIHDGTQKDLYALIRDSAKQEISDRNIQSPTWQPCGIRLLTIYHTR